MRMRLNVIILLSCLLGVASPAEAKKIKVAIPSESIQQIAFYVAQEQGYYQQEGLEVELILMSGRVSNLALLGGDVEFNTSPGSALTAGHRGAPIRILFSTFYAPMHWLYATPAISNVSQLKGKRVAVSSVGAATDFLLREVLKRHGLESAREVIVLGMGVQSTRLGALVNGSVDAAMLTFPLNFSAQELGFRELVSFLKEGLVQLSGSIVAQDLLLQSDPAMVRKFLTATYKGLQYSRENREGTKRILTRRLRIKEDVAGKIYDLAQPGITMDGTLSAELQKAAVDLVFKSPEAADAQSWRKFFDFSLARNISAELNAQSRGAEK